MGYYRDIKQSIKVNLKPEFENKFASSKDVSIHKYGIHMCSIRASASLYANSLAESFRSSSDSYNLSL